MAGTAWRAAYWSWPTAPAEFAAAREEKGEAEKEVAVAPGGGAGRAWERVAAPPPGACAQLRHRPFSPCPPPVPADRAGRESGCSSSAGITAVFFATACPCPHYCLKTPLLECVSSCPGDFRGRV